MTHQNSIKNSMERSTASQSADALQSQAEAVNAQAREAHLEESFETGRQALRSLLPVADSESLDAETLKSLEASIQSPLHALALFWIAYFTARLKIEQSYDFNGAFALYEWGRTQLEHVPEALQPAPCLVLEMTLYVYMVGIDRGIHNNDFLSAIEACDQLNQLLESAPTCAKSLSLEKFYIEVMADTARLLYQRDHLGGVSEEAWQGLKERLYQSYVAFREKGLEIYSSIIQACLMALPVWQEAGGERLKVRRGRMVATYYATLDTFDTSAVVQTLTLSDQRQRLIETLGVNEFYEPEPPDIFSDLSYQNQFRVWVFELPEVVLPKFRHHGIEFQTVLRINSLGILQLQLTTDLAENDVNGLRHLMNLPLENALDEEILWREHAFQYLSEMAVTVFEQVNQWLASETLASSLLYQVSSDVSVLMMVEEAYTASIECLTPEQFYAHPDWIGIQVPPREVRSVYENWRLQCPHEGVQNLANDLYHRQDWVQTDGHYSAAVMLDQPTWVTEQTLEHLQVVTALKFYMHQLGHMLFNNLQTIQLSLAEGDEEVPQSRRALKAQEENYLAQVKRLERLRRELKQLIQLLESGQLMRFPDHGRFIDQLYQASGMLVEKQHLQTLLDQVNENAKFLRGKVSLALEKIQEQSKQRFEAVIGFFGFLLSIGAISDLYGLMDEAGIHFSGWFKLESVLLILGAVTLYFVIEWLIRKLR